MILPVANVAQNKDRIHTDTEANIYDNNLQRGLDWKSQTTPMVPLLPL